MSRDFYDLSVEDRNKLKLIAANSNYLQNVKGYDDYYMAENVWGVKVDTYDDYKLYGPGKAVLRFVRIAEQENISLDRFLCNRLDVPFFRTEPSIIKPCDYALKLLDTTVSLESLLTPAERDRIAYAYFRALGRWALPGGKDGGY